MKNRLVEYARLQWIEGEDDANGAVPRSDKFDDIYYAGDGREETAHVFLSGNNLAQQFTTHSRFAIGETGFGTGLNILSAWDLWRETKKPIDASLHFLSFEKYPLCKDDLERAHKNWPEFSHLSDIILQQWPANIAGFHRLNLEDNVSLTLFFGDILDGLSQHPNHPAPINAWFLDGFAPSKNPDIWSESVFEGMARLSREGTSLATFTVAGHVRRRLTAAGFAVEKTQGFGRKREMLRGTFQSTLTPSDQPLMANDKPWFSPQNLTTLLAGQKVAIIGGGIAGASLAYNLNKTGLKPTIFEQDKLASGASGNRAGLIMPRLDRDDNAPARFSLHAWLYTLRLLTILQDQNPDISLFTQCGAAKFGRTDRDREILSALIEEDYLPKGWIEKHKDGIFFPHGGVISPPDFVRLLIGDTPVLREKIKSIENTATSIGVTSDIDTHQFDAVIYANSFEARKFQAVGTLPISGAAGQIDVYEMAPAPAHAQVFGPYLAPLPGNQKIGQIIGATYRPLEETKECLEPSPEAADENLESLRPFTDLKGIKLHDAISRVSVRCVTPDQIPIAGPLPDWAFYTKNYDGLRDGRIGPYSAARYQRGHYALIGLGSRGLVTAPLAAAMIVSQMTGTPAPVPRDLFETLHPARFFIRSVKRPKPRHQKKQKS